jgi:DNA-binding Lrp family transcriptional regulator
METKDIELVRVLQNGEIFLKERPFHEAAILLNCTVEEVLGRVRRLKETGVIRRFGARLSPMNTALPLDLMAVFNVDDFRAEEAGSLLSGHARVSHCYIRPRFEGFPFNIYATAHGSSPEDMARVVKELSGLAASSSYRALYSLREFKKSSPVYYPKALEPTVA